MLTRSKDRKVTNAVTAGGNCILANAFGLPAGVAFSCPGATSFCEKICYAGRIERMYTAVKNILVRNFEALLYADYLEGIEGMEGLLIDMVNDFGIEVDFLNEKRVKKNLPTVPPVFRIHWDGDFFNENYAQAWANVIDMFPTIQFWVYTRSFTDNLNVLPIITGLDNLTVYLSADPVNIELANQRASEFPGVFITTVADTFAEARATIIDPERKVFNCPENGGRIPLISPKGSACVRCGVCVKGRGDVTFSVMKK